MKPTFQRSTTERIIHAAPNLKYIAFYHADEERLNSCLNDYVKRAFVYVLSADYKGQEHFLYVGKSKSQYARMLNHSKKYAFDHLYLFECEPEQLTECERAVIHELTPLFNKNCNPMLSRYENILCIDYRAIQDKESIHHYLDLYDKYKEVTLYGFSLPAVLFSIVEQKASASNLTCSEWLQTQLEKLLSNEVATALPKYDAAAQSNLISCKAYGALHNRSQEQVKQYLRQGNRIAGGLKMGRDWVFPRDARFPEDKRKRSTKIGS